MVALLLESGADPNKSGAPWATPLAWAQKKGYADIEADLSMASGGLDSGIFLTPDGVDRSLTK
jgi:hypothetical protein